MRKKHHSTFVHVGNYELKELNYLNSEKKFYLQSLVTRQVSWNSPITRRIHQKMENRISTVHSYPKAYRFMEKNGARKSHATVPLSIEHRHVGYLFNVPNP